MLMLLEVERVMAPAYRAMMNAGYGKEMMKQIISELIADVDARKYITYDVGYAMEHAERYRRDFCKKLGDQISNGKMTVEQAASLAEMPTAEFLGLSIQIAADEAREKMAGSEPIIIDPYGFYPDGIEEDDLTEGEE